MDWAFAKDLDPLATMGLRRGLDSALTKVKVPSISRA